jgi:hypothetical protein
MVESNRGRNYSPSLGPLQTRAKYEEEIGSLASLMLSSTIHSTDMKKKRFPITLFGEDVRHAFGTSEALGQCVSFCPRYLDHLLKDGHGTVMGCILLVDISGFTKLSSALCTQGSTGIDMLRKITENSFAQFVECVYLHGGDGRFLPLPCGFLWTSSLPWPPPPSSLFSSSLLPSPPPSH